MLNPAKVSEYVKDVRNRINGKIDEQNRVNFNMLSYKEQMSHIVSKEQCETYLEFINEFERLVLAMDEC